MAETENATRPPDFSLVLGGPLYQFLRRARLSGDALQGLRRRIVVLTVLSWVPLLVLSIIEGHAVGASVALPFLSDIEAHVRFLLAVPVLIAAEIVVHRRLWPVVQQFVERRLIPDSEMDAFEAAIASAMRLRSSVVAEVLLLLFVYVVGVGLLWRTQIALTVASWHGTPGGALWRPTAAGWWLGLVSLPLFQFLLFRWYFRVFVWTRFLWQVSRLDLKLAPAHPDRCGGLGFLGAVGQAFSPLILAQGALMAGMIANRIFYTGAELTGFTVELIGMVIAMLLVVIGPLCVFSVKLEAAKQEGLRDYGALAQRYVRDYDRKWLRGGASPGELFLGSPDIQSLADLSTGFDVVKEMRWVPCEWATPVRLAVTALLPVVPLAFTMISLNQLLERLLNLLF